MASPSQFFVSLAQVSGTVVAFIIAISTALYSIEREELARRTQALREDMAEFRDRFERGIDLMLQVIEESTHKNANVQGYRLEGKRQNDGIDGVKRLAENNDSSDVAAVYYQLYALKKSMESIDGSISADEMNTVLSNIDKKHSDVKGNIADKDGFGLDLYMELRGKQDERKIPDDHMIVPGTLSDEDGEFNNWLIDELDRESLSINDPHESIQRRLDPKEGRLQYIDTILRLSAPLLRQMKERKNQGLVNGDQLIGQVIRLSAGFSLVSIVLPLVLILTIPEFLVQWLSSSIPQWLNDTIPSGLIIFVTEALILTSAVTIAVPLIEVPLKQMAGESDADDLSGVSRWVIRRVDRRTRNR